MEKKKYDFRAIEKKWQAKWIKSKAFRARDDSKKQKYYQLETFPYPSAAGLHVGHPKGYIAEDIHARFMRMNDREVLYTMGWDAFGLPTENYAIKVGKSPQEVAKSNIKNFKRQVQMFGLSYDWERELNTSDPAYYKWTQWLFIQMWKKGLAYQKKQAVNWCPNDQTVLANEQVVNGNCERCGAKVEQREMKQWLLKITDYADRLLDDVKNLDWPEASIKRQKDWIGKSEGAELDFGVSGSQFSIKVFTTRPDTLFGATYLVLAPEHPLVKNLESRIKNLEEVRKYIETTKGKTELQRQEEVKDKTGVELKGVKAINPATQEEIPVWIADYVLGSYGTRAIMAVPAHDERDFAFAKKFNLEIVSVIKPGVGKSDELYAGAGALVNSGKFDGMDSEEAKWEITKSVGGKKKVQYRLRDWSVSRQRYWGVPIPMIECEACGVVPVPEDDLPVKLPPLKDYRPKGVPPLASSRAFMSVKCPSCKGKATRDPETLDTFVDSSWYFLRYTDPANKKEIFNKEKAAHWLPVDLYIIGAEHTTLHLLYARFITKFLNAVGHVNFKEPFMKLRHQGLILGADGQKMSKSKGNVVNPDELVKEFGADTVRLYEMFMGPFDQGQPWDVNGVLGVHRFLMRLWKYIEPLTEAKNIAPGGSEKKGIHKAVKKVGEDIGNFGFNTAISALMIMLNDLEKSATSPSKKEIEMILKILHPFAPHIAQELWSKMGNKTLLDFEPWPVYNPKLIEDDTFTLVIQVNGKVRDSVEAARGISESEAKKLALTSEKVQKLLEGKEPKKFIYVPGKIANIVI